MTIYEIIEFGVHVQQPVTLTKIEDTLVSGIFDTILHHYHLCASVNIRGHLIGREGIKHTHIALILSSFS